MYAVIRTGGKQYKVAPGDLLKIESVPSGSPTIEFSDVLAVSGEPGTLAKPASATVTAEVVGQGRGDKILVFHFKRKKQYKKLNGHRQQFTQVRIAEISFGGQKFSAPELVVKAPKAKKHPAAEAVEAPAKKAAPKAKKAPAKKVEAKKAVAKKPAAKKTPKKK